MAPEKRKLVHFKVHYQLIGSPSKVTSDYLLRDRPELMRMLFKNEGVSANKCEFMYIHQIAKDGTVKEVMSYERTKSVALLPPPAPPPATKTETRQKSLTDVVQDIIDSERKHALGRYTFMEAP